MRSRLLLLAPIGASVVIAAACSSFRDDPTSADAAGSDAPSGVDAALPPTPGLVECFGASCNGAANEDCCFDYDAGTTACANKCTNGTVTLHCDDKSDCAPNQICCVGLFGNSDCQATCSGERLCHANSECEVGSSCVEVPCRGSTIGACGPVGPYVTDFCKKR